MCPNKKKDPLNSRPIIPQLKTPSETSNNRNIPFKKLCNFPNFLILSCNFPLFPCALMHLCTCAASGSSQRRISAFGSRHFKSLQNLPPILAHSFWSLPSVLAYLLFCRGSGASCLRDCLMLMLASGRNATQTARSYLRAYKAPHVGLRQHKQPTKFSQYASRDTQNG